MRDLRGKRVLITGGARGIGRSLALRFAAEGAEILLADVDEAALAETVQAVRSTGGTARSYTCDVSDRASVLELRDALHRDGGAIDVLVNNAGVVFGGPFLEVPVDKHLETYRVNTLGLVAMTHAFLPDLISGPQGHLVNISSAAGIVGLPYGATYASSKWSVNGFAESLRLELRAEGHHHVKLTTVCPSYVDTGLFSGARPFRTSRMLEPDWLAARIVKAVRRDKLYVLAPPLVKLTPAMKGILPRRLFDSINWLLGVTSGMKHWRGR